MCANHSLERLASPRTEKNGDYPYYIPGTWCLVPGNALMAVVSFGVFTTTSVLEGPILERLSRAPPGQSRPRVRATPAPHGGTRSSAKEQAPAPLNSTSGERRKEPSPIPDIAGDRKNMEIPL